MKPLAPVLATLALALVAGYAADAAGAPLPWLLGALGATATAAMAGLRVAGSPLRLPKRTRMVCVPVIGVTIGASVTPEILGQASQWWPSLLAVVPYVLAVQFLNYAVLRRIGRLDRPTAFFAASPGGLIDAVLSGEARGGRVTTMSTLHFSRIALTVSIIPFLITMLADIVPTNSAGEAAATWPDPAGALTLLACAILGAWAGTRLRLPAGVMLGPFVLSAALHLSGLTDATPPGVVVQLAQMAVGATLGVQFAGVARRQVAQGVGLAALSVAVALVVAAALALTLPALVDAPASAVFLAFAPGGLAEMGLVAVSLGAEPAFVIVHHILRIVLTVSIAPALFDRLVAREGG